MYIEDFKDIHQVTEYAMNKIAVLEEDGHPITLKEFVEMIMEGKYIKRQDEIDLLDSFRAVNVDLIDSLIQATKEL